MARIAGVNIPTNKRVIIALTYIHGIGRSKAVEIADKLGIDHSRRVQDLSDEEVLRVRETIDADFGDCRPGCVVEKRIPLAAFSVIMNTRSGIKTPFSKTNTFYPSLPNDFSKLEYVPRLTLIQNLSFLEIDHSGIWMKAIFGVGQHM